jgi:hypothetical protein
MEKSTLRKNGNIKNINAKVEIVVGKCIVLNALGQWSLTWSKRTPGYAKTS